MVLKTIAILTFLVVFTWGGLASQAAPSAVNASVASSALDSAKTSQASKDSLLTQGPKVAEAPQVNKSRADSIKVVKHNFNHREQIITGSVVMLCLALVLVTMNNYNPR